MILRKFSSKTSPPIFRQVTHVIFDLDGTLLDTEHVYDKAISDAVNEYGKTYTSEIRAKVVGRTATDSSRIAIKEMDLPVSIEDFVDKWKTKAYAVFSQKVDLMPGAERLVRHLHGNRVPIAVASATSREGFELKTSHHRELFKLFDHVVAGASDPQVENGKPSPDVFLVCASRFIDKPVPENCLVFEDSMNGVAAARAAKMQVVWIPSHPTNVVLKDGQSATLILKSLVQFKPELFGLPAFNERK